MIKIQNIFVKLFSHIIDIHLTVISQNRAQNKKNSNTKQEKIMIKLTKHS